MRFGSYTWDIDDEDRMFIRICHGKQLLFRIFVGEVLDFVGRNKIEEHIREIENSPWIKSWHPTQGKADVSKSG